MTSKDSVGLPEACADGNLMLTFGSKELDREMIWTRIHFRTYVQPKFILNKVIYKCSFMCSNVKSKIGGTPSGTPVVAQSTNYPGMSSENEVNHENCQPG